jgi:predicted RNA binding protein YcfA (HicA-like mRNA interferase family)
MSQFPSIQAGRLLRALQRAGWVEVRCVGSHRTLQRSDAVMTFAFHLSDEVGPRMVARVCRASGLNPEDL